jgi:hypothetical protein
LICWCATGSAFRSSSHTKTHRFQGQHRFEHWYRDNTVYFITSKVRDGFPALRSDDAKSVFWDRFDHWTRRYDFEPWVATLLDNHYHVLGYLKKGENLGPMMQKLHGSVAKLVNDVLPKRHLPFWRFKGNRDYFDGCLRTETQLRRTYPYVLNQAVKAGIVRRIEDYPHTRAPLQLARCVELASDRRCYLPDVRYPRYS